MTATLHFLVSRTGIFIGITLKRVRDLRFSEQR